MFKVIFASTILIASSASAGEIVWRSPVTGVLPHVSDSLATEPEPEREAPTGLGVTYPALSVSGGKSFSFSPSGLNGGGYEFSASGLPAGLILSQDGRLAGVLMVAGMYSFEVIVRRGGDFERVSVSIVVV
ncbi:hypothetical protein ELI38_15505 [Rhizobium leguminosarum]|uniref:putative Ig domain-containing protein n=1 Tax=Rhizobium leguminosarum TaxID=384 RepID=UPI0010308223|nr:putative Ig domain-containing protein [Rhizobium leguminosarum]TAU97278.1 hypothetical protein ELI38_15505 [Rhizobium leguminosarum]